MTKSISLFLCSNCGNEFTKWSGQCPACGEWNSLSEASALIAPTKASHRRRNPLAQLTTPKAVLADKNRFTWSTQLGEFDRVLGPGLTAGGVYLLAGEPGIGKSTILTQLTLKASTAKRGQVLYVCSEESPTQVAARIDRLSAKKYSNEQITLLGTSTLEDILETLSKPKETTTNFALVIVDSIQSVATGMVDGQAGTVSQIRACSNLLIQAAKSTGIPIILVGHVTKAGTLAGPKLLEHMVDVVLELEGDRHYDLRLLRGLKNRFGPTDETGLFQMTSMGLIDITDPNAVFLNKQTRAEPRSAS